MLQGGIRVGGVGRVGGRGEAGVGWVWADEEEGRAGRFGEEEVVDEGTAHGNGRKAYLIYNIVMAL